LTRCQNGTEAPIYRTLPAAVIVKPRAVGIMNALLASYAADIITEETFQELILKQIHAGAMLASWESVQVHLTGRQQGHCVEFTMSDDRGPIDGKRWTIADNIIKQRSE